MKRVLAVLLLLLLLGCTEGVSTTYIIDRRGTSNGAGSSATGGNDTFFDNAECDSTCNTFYDYGTYS